MEMFIHNLISQYSTKQTSKFHHPIAWRLPSCEPISQFGGEKSSSIYSVNKKKPDKNLIFWSVQKSARKQNITYQWKSGIYILADREKCRSSDNNAAASLAMWVICNPHHAYRVFILMACTCTYICMHTHPCIWLPQCLKRAQAFHTTDHQKTPLHLWVYMGLFHVILSQPDLIWSDFFFFLPL